MTNKILLFTTRQLCYHSAGFFAAQLADALEISYSHYTRVEEGRRGMSLKMLYRLVDYYDTDANTILGMSAKEERKHGR